MEQTALNTALEFLKDHELKSHDNSYPLGIVRREDCERAIRLALSTYTKLLNSSNEGNDNGSESKTGFTDKGMTVLSAAMIICFFAAAVYFALTTILFIIKMFS